MLQINWDELSSKNITDISKGKKTALSIGVFDGLHRGHLHLIEKITAQAPQLLPTVICFRNNPKNRSGIITFEEKMALLADFGIELCVIIDFSEHFGKMDGRAFIEIVSRYLSPAYIVLGANFYCGYRRDTDAGTFKTTAENLGISTEIVDPVMEGGLPVSSSRIRKALRAGNTDEAELLLGRRIL